MSEGIFPLKVTYSKVHVFVMLIGFVVGLGMCILQGVGTTVIWCAFQHLYGFQLAGASSSICEQASVLEEKATHLALLMALLDHGLQDSMLGVFSGGLLLLVWKVIRKFLIVGPYNDRVIRSPKGSST
jgi:hypothetical protein